MSRTARIGELVNAPAEVLEKALTHDVMLEALAYAARDLQPIIDVVLKKHGVSSATYVGEQACVMLKDCIEAVTASLRKQSSGYVGLRWLWMLRRLPESVFEGDYTSTKGYDRTLAEVIAGNRNGRSAAEQSGRGEVHYPLDDTIVKRLARYCGAVQVLSVLHRDYRWAGKGASYTFKKGRLPEKTVSTALRESVYLYDERAALGGAHGRMGTEVFGPTRSTVDLRALRDSFDGTLQGIYRVVSIKPVDFPVPLPDTDITDESAPRGLVRARYLIIPIPLANLEALVKQAPASGPPVIDATSAALLFLLFGSMVYVGQHRAGLLSLFTVGYLQSDDSFLRNSLAGAFTIVPAPLKQLLDTNGVRSADAAIELLSSIAGSAWPLAAGPLIHRDGASVALDLAAASNRLESSVVYPRVQGDVANVRASHFELRVQDAIDKSKYAPPPDVRALRGQTLRLHGRPVTDLDAVACTGNNTLLFVSCKSVIYSPEYDMGEFRAVRGAASTVRKAQQDLADDLATLRATPCDSYDFTKWTLIGVVCTPSVVWIELGPCTAFVLDGLRAAVSLSELQEWLSGRSSTSRS